MKKHVFNPYLPSWEFVPDGEPYVFGDRLYLYGSHDEPKGTIPQVELTSCGLNGGPLPAKGRYPSYIACHLTEQDRTKVGHVVEPKPAGGVSPDRIGQLLEDLSYGHCKFKTQRRRPSHGL